MSDFDQMRVPLPMGTVLKGRYHVLRLIGKGGFALTYLADDREKQCQVAIKEYFPSKIAVRESSIESRNDVVPVSENAKEWYEKGLLRFEKEAKLLEQFRGLEGIVSADCWFMENQTVYLVMEFIDGISLREYVQTNGCLAEAELLLLMQPVLESISAIHKQKIFHRDISPDNLLLGLDGSFYLIDFGAAVQEQLTKNLTHTIMLKSGFAPPEQYISGAKIGPWTDIYALCATMYFAMTGESPADALKRTEGEEICLPDEISLQMRTILRKGLQLAPTQRFSSVDAFLQALFPTEEAGQKTWWQGMDGELPEKGQFVLRKTTFPIVKVLAVGTIVIVVLLLGYLAGRHIMPFRSPESIELSEKPEQEEAWDNISSEESADGRENLSETVLPERGDGESSKEALLVMPDLKGLSLKKAKKKLKETDISIRIRKKYKYHKSIRKGYVITQNVLAKTRFSKGQLKSVVLTLSKGMTPVPVKTPGHSEEVATASPKTVAQPGATKDTKEKKDYQAKAQKKYSSVTLE